MGDPLLNISVRALGSNRIAHLSVENTLVTVFLRTVVDLLGSVGVDLLSVVVLTNAVLAQGIDVDILGIVIDIPVKGLLVIPLRVVLVPEFVYSVLQRISWFLFRNLFTF